MNKLHTPDQFKNPTTQISVGFIGLVLLYLLVSRAIDTGSIFQYTVAFALLFLSIRLIYRGFKSK